MRMRDYCTSPKHVFEMCLNIIRVAYETGNYPLVSQYVSKAESAFSGFDETEKKEFMDVYSKLQIASGLAHLDSSNYKEAALKFLSVHDDLENGYNDVLSDLDIASIGGILTVVSFDRIELREMLAADIHFKNFLEKTPKVEEILTSFHDGQYPTLFKLLNEIQVRNFHC
jgi:COP9 signalosome complex subunit 1